MWFVWEWKSNTCTIYGKPYHFCIHLQTMVSQATLLEYRFPSRIDFTECRNIVNEALQLYCKRWCKKGGFGVHVHNNWKNKFLRIVVIRIENSTTRPHLYKLPPGRNLQITSKLLTHGYRYHKLRKTWQFFGSYSELLSKFGKISFQEYVWRNLSPVFYSDLV